MNGYQTIFEYEPSGSNLILLIPILLLLGVGLAIVIYTKKIFKMYSFLRQVILSFGYILIAFTVIILIISLVKAPVILSKERNFNKLIESSNYLIVEGETENFIPMSKDGHKKEMFSVKEIQFEYSDYIMTKGFHRTSLNNGPITRNGQKVRISYITEDNINLIMKIELKE